MSDKDNDNDRYQDGVIKHPDVIKKEMEKEKAELENFYRTMDITIRFYLGTQSFNCYINRSCKINGE
jgi:hypothetical protein